MFLVLFCFVCLFIFAGRAGTEVIKCKPRKINEKLESGTFPKKKQINEDQEKEFIHVNKKSSLKLRLPRTFLNLEMMKEI